MSKHRWRPLLRAVKVPVSEDRVAATRAAAARVGLDPDEAEAGRCH
jgi:hypothetical protein